MPSSEYNDTTTHYSFNKPHTDAPVNIEDLNANMDTLDSTLYSVETKANASKTITDKITMSDSRYQINAGISVSDQSSMWKDFGGKDGYCGIRAVRGNASMDWLPSAYGSGIMAGVQDTSFYVGGNHNTSSSVFPTVAFAGGTGSNSTISDPNWYFKIKGENGGEYDLSLLNKSEVTEASFKALFDTTNVVNITNYPSAGILKKCGGMCMLYFSLCLALNTAQSGITLLTLPTGFRPTIGLYTPAMQLKTKNQVQCQILANGNVLLWPTAETTTTYPRYTLLVTYAVF